VWILRSIILLIGVAALVWLGTKNAGTKVTFHLFTKTYIDVELNLIMVITFIAGMLVWAIGAWIREAQLRLNLIKTRRDIHRLHDEISDLRNLPLEEEEPDITG
jgi:uncharacterized membrane protein YciS (DUF1049 family)